MSAQEVEPCSGISVGEEVSGKSEAGLPIITVTLNVLDDVPRGRVEMNTINWCGGQKIHLGGVAGAKALFEELGNQIARWEALQAAGKAVIK